MDSMGGRHEAAAAAGRARPPRLETARLVIRPFRPADWRDLHRYLARPEVYRFEPGSPIDAATARHLAAQRGAGSGFWALQLRAQRRVVGHCSFLKIGHPPGDTRDLGFIIDPEHQGVGYAAEAGGALVDHAFAVEGVHRVVAHCHPGNTASARTLERIGFVLEGRLRQDVTFRSDADGRPIWQDTLAYGLLVSDRGVGLNDT